MCFKQDALPTTITESALNSQISDILFYMNVIHFKIFRAVHKLQAFYILQLVCHFTVIFFCEPF